MKKNTFAIAILAFGFSAPVLAVNPACEQKKIEIQRQIQHAQEAGNTHRMRGLETALSKVKTYCTDAGLIKDQKKDIADQQKDIDDLLEEIQEKESEGRYDKVKKLERKLAYKRQELEDLQQELKELESL